MNIKKFKNGYVINNDAISGLKTLDSKSVQACVTSPPYYGLRSYCEDVVKVRKDIPKDIFKQLKGVSSVEVADEAVKEKLYNIQNIPEKYHEYFEPLEIGREETPKQYIEGLVEVFKEIYRVMCDDGVLFLNIGDSYAGSAQGVGSPPGGKQATNKGSISKKSLLLKVEGVQRKELVGIPWQLAFALREIGFMIRQDIIWHKPNPFPSSVRDRFCVAHEYLFMLVKKPKYKFNYEEALEKASYAGINRGLSDNRYEQASSTLGKVYDKRLKRDVWSIQPAKYKGAHFATFPTELVDACIRTATEKGDTVIDPFFGSGTVGEVATKLNRKFIGIELNPDYIELNSTRVELAEVSLDLVECDEINMFE